ncbi:MAG: hypothetical protein FJ102_06065 [Deltaproteobacteria bacterium]|nr:hypothetical protein [Deltaproteobacteria bacterium]
MSRELSDILPSLEPPPGGRDRLVARVRSARPVAPRYAALAAAALLLAAFLARDRGARPPVATADPVMLALAGDAGGLRVLGARAAAGRVALGRDDVVYYRVVVAGP